jgi:hypothetical protein
MELCQLDSWTTLYLCILKACVFIYGIVPIELSHLGYVQSYGFIYAVVKNADFDNQGS